MTFSVAASLRLFLQLHFFPTLPNGVNGTSGCTVFTTGQDRWSTLNLLQPFPHTQLLPEELWKKKKKNLLVAEVKLDVFQQHVSSLIAATRKPKTHSTWPKWAAESWKITADLISQHFLFGVSIISFKKCSASVSLQGIRQSVLSTSVLCCCKSLHVYCLDFSKCRVPKLAAAARSGASEFIERVQSSVCCNSALQLSW